MLARDQVLPPDALAETPVAFALAFVHAAAGFAGLRKFGLSSVEGALSALTFWHRAKSMGAVSGPSANWAVKQAVRAFEIVVAAHERVVRAEPVTLRLLEAMQVQVWAALAAIEPGAHTWALRYRLARNWLFYVLSWLCALRTNEGLTARFSAQYLRVVDGQTQFCVEFSKNRRTERHWSVLQSSGPGEISFERALRPVERLLLERGFESVEGLPLFGSSFDPTQQLGSAFSLFSNSAFVAPLVAPALVALGRRDMLDAVWTGYSLRRGSINHLYMLDKRAGLALDVRAARLLAHGRWKSASSLLVYLVEIDDELAAHLKLRIGRTSSQASALQ